MAAHKGTATRPGLNTTEREFSAMSTPILTRITNLINLGQSLAQAVETVLPGADPAYWQRQLSRANQSPTKLKKQSSKHTGKGKPSKRANYASQVAGRAMAELVQRVNEPETRAILLTANGETLIMEVR